MNFLKKLKNYIVKLLVLDYTEIHEQEVTKADGTKITVNDLNESVSTMSSGTYIDWKTFRTVIFILVVELVIVLLVDFLFF